MGSSKWYQSIWRYQINNMEIINNQIFTIMKKIFTLLLSLLLVASFSINANAQKKQKASIKEVTFITSIDCASCAKKLEALLPYERGVKDLKISVETATVWFKYDETKTTKEKLAQAIIKEGFTAKEVVLEENKESEKK